VAADNRRAAVAADTHPAEVVVDTHPVAVVVDSHPAGVVVDTRHPEAVGIPLEAAAVDRSFTSPLGVRI
jgi:hypothetical protein